jgi:trimeric autotransporter adhesin
MRNICSKCGCDSNGKGASNSTGPPFYIPTAAGDSSGVAPNITFEVDGIDFYTTGNLLYNGQWVKKGFTFLTGATQSSFTLKFFNNAPGGGGNDWTLDDISVSTCSPDMVYSPSIYPFVCQGNSLTIYDTVRSYFNNYNYYKWQRSIDGGFSWFDVTGPLGPSLPFWNGTAWEYVSAYTIPPAQTTMANSGDKYQLVVATTLLNLSNINCRFTDGGNIITLTVIDCGEPLDAQLLSFSGSVADNKATLRWTTTGEDGPLFFDIEKNSGGSAFSTVFTINGYNSDSTAINSYTWNDPQKITEKVYYRLKMYNTSGNIKYSKIIAFASGKEAFDLISVVNPFTSELLFDVVSDRAGVADARLIDPSGKPVKIVSFDIQTGINNLRIDNISSLRPGVYILRMQSNGEVIFRKVVKQ